MGFKIEQVSHFCPTPAINALIIITDYEDTGALLGSCIIAAHEEAQHFQLTTIGILKLIDEDPLELFLKVPPDMRIASDEIARTDQQIGEEEGIAACAKQASGWLKQQAMRCGAGDQILAHQHPTYRAAACAGTRPPAGGHCGPEPLSLCGPGRAGPATRTSSEKGRSKAGMRRV